MNMSGDEAGKLHENRFDPDEWEDEPVDIEVRKPTSDVVSFRLPREEFDRLHRAASAADSTLSAFIREALADKIDGRTVSAIREMTWGAARVFGPTQSTRRTVASAEATLGVEFQSSL